MTDKANRYKVVDGMYIVGFNVCKMFRQCGFHDKVFHYYKVVEGKPVLVSDYEGGPKNHNGFRPYNHEDVRFSAMTFAQATDFLAMKFHIHIRGGGTQRVRKKLSRSQKQRKAAMEEILNMPQNQLCDLNSYLPMDTSDWIKNEDEYKFLKEKGLGRYRSFCHLRHEYYEEFSHEGYGPLVEVMSYNVDSDAKGYDEHPEYYDFLSIGGFSDDNRYRAYSDIYMYLLRNLIRKTIKRKYKI